MHIRRRNRSEEESSLMVQKVAGSILAMPRFNLQQIFTFSTSNTRDLPKLLSEVTYRYMYLGHIVTVLDLLHGLCLLKKTPELCEDKFKCHFPVFKLHSYTPLWLYKKTVCCKYICNFFSHV